MNMNFKLVLPKKSDYPQSLRILVKPGRSATYHQLVEASASAYFETKGPTKWLFMRRFQVALEHLCSIVPIDTLLDAGTGIGFFLPTLSRLAGQITAVDYANHTLSYAKRMCRNKKINNINFLQADLLKFKSRQKFSAITALSVLEHIPPQKLPALMKKFRSWLKPGGYLIAGWPNEGDWLFHQAQTWEKRLLRPKMLQSLRDKKRHYQPLGHVSQGQQIYRAVTQQFKAIKFRYLPFSWIRFYAIGIFAK